MLWLGSRRGALRCLRGTLWLVDCLNVNEIEDNTFGKGCCMFILLQSGLTQDKTLTVHFSRCGHWLTPHQYYHVLQEWVCHNHWNSTRILIPGGRLKTISLHKEIEVLSLGCNNLVCSFVELLCTLTNTRRDDTWHSHCILFNKWVAAKMTRCQLFPICIFAFYWIHQRAQIHRTWMENSV